MTYSAFSRMSVAACLVLGLTLAPPSFAETTVPNSTAADLQTQCLLAKDHHTNGTNSRFTRCCSFTLGYCIECTMDKDEPCEKFEVRSGLDRRFQPTARDTGPIVAPRPDPTPLNQIVTPNNFVPMLTKR